MKPPEFIRFFFLRTALFFLPVAALFVFPAWVLWASGELIPVERMVELQQGSAGPVKVGLAYSNPEKYFKLRSFLARRSEIVVLGNSHVMTMHEEFFNGRSFYNAAVGGSRLPDFKAFVDHIPEGREPKVLIAGLDPFFAKPDYDWSRKEEERFDRDSGRLAFVRTLGSSWKNIYRDYFQGKFSAGALRDRSAAFIGLEAVVRGRGFLKDGSHVEAKSPPVFTGTVQDYSHLKGGESFDEEGLRSVEDFLKTCHERGIRVIGLLPPAREAVYEQLRASGYRYWEELPQKLEPFFKKYGFALCDASHPSLYGGNDGEFYDDFHASEEAFRRITGLIPWSGA